LSWAAYGWRTGVWRALELLNDLDVTATFYASGILSETSPESLRAIVDSGHELAAHAWSQDRLPAKLDRAAEAEEIRRCTEALATASGARPRGWISPRCTPSASTAELLAGQDYHWFGDVFDADLPYHLETPAGPIVALPFGMEINDLPLSVRYGQPMRELLGCFEDAVAAAQRMPSAALIDVTIHAHVGARPIGLHALERVIRSAREQGCWLATRAEVAAASRVVSSAG
jgi:peptidoglycan/xylan/chitin deacetylase (PgdA/CDA1 family)